MQRVGLAVLALQFVGLAIWSQILSSRFALETDYLGYGQAWYLIAHGHLNPYTTGWGEQFFRDHGSFFMVLLAPLWWLWPHGVVLLWLQAAAIVVGEAVAFVWMCEVAGTVAARHRRGADPQLASTGWRASISDRVELSSALSVLGLLLLVANPWLYWTASFDFHFEVFGACFAMLLAYDVAHHHRRAWIWFVLTILTGDVAITYVLGVGLSALLAGKAWRRQGGLLVLLSFAAFGAENALGFSHGSGLVPYLRVAGSGQATASGHGQPVATGGIGGLKSLLHAIVTQPVKFLEILRKHFLNIYANVAPAGGIGIVCAWGIGVPLVVLLENNLRAGVLFSATPFQNEPVYLFIALGTIMVLVWMAEHWRNLTWILGAVIVVSSIGWSATWFPKTADTWLHVSPAAASVLNSTLHRLPPNDEVAATHGIVGAFGERTKVVSFEEQAVPVLARHMWFVVAPQQGIDIVPVKTGFSNLGTLAGPMGAKLIAHGGGVWVFRWDPPTGTKVARFPLSCSTIPAWALPSNAGYAVLGGASTDWGIDATGAPGYVVSGDYWRLPKGPHVAGVRLTANGPVSVQVWDADRQVLIAQREVTSVQDDGVVAVPFSVPTPVKRPSTEGVGPFRLVPEPPPAEDQIEVRVYSPGGTGMHVSSITIVSSSLAQNLIIAAHSAC